MNRAYNFDQQGNDLGYYDKRHLFSCDLSKDDGNKKIVEADIYTAGTKAKIIQLDKFNIGLGICFDVRYPMTGQEYRNAGVNILTYSSAFTVPTGKAHWHTLLRARAIENQCFVVACAQWGKHNEKIQTYGHSLVIDPWGDVKLDAREGTGLHFCELDLSLVERTRKKIKVT